MPTPSFNSASLLFTSQPAGVRLDQFLAVCYFVGIVIALRIVRSPVGKILSAIRRRIVRSPVGKILSAIRRRSGIMSTATS